MAEIEIWMDIKDFEGLYKISNYGNIYSLITNKKINAFNIGDGYCGVSFRKNNRYFRKYVHRLVAEAFIPNPENKKEVNHIDGNKLNNNVDNLEWCTRSENEIHAYKHNLKKPTKGKQNIQSLKVIQIDINTGKKIKEYDGVREAERIIGVPHGNIINCCKGKIKSAGGYKWRYKSFE